MAVPATLDTKLNGGAAYNGLTAILFENKKYADSLKVCQEFMELEVDKQLDEDLERGRLAVRAHRSDPDPGADWTGCRHRRYHQYKADDFGPAVR